MWRPAVALVGLAMAATACGGSSHPSARNAAPSPASTASPTTVQPVVDAAGARLTPPKAPTSKPPDADPNCQTLIDAGFDGSCRLAVGAHATAALVDEAMQAAPANEHRLLVYRKTSDGFSLALRFSEPTAATAAPTADAFVSDVAQDHDPKIVVAYRDASQDDTATTPTLNGIDVVEATGTVVVHRDLSHGEAAAATGGGLETWSRIDNTSPLQYRHQVIRYHDGDWRIEKDEQLAAEAVPKPDPKSGTTFT